MQWRLTLIIGKGLLNIGEPRKDLTLEKQKSLRGGSRDVVTNWTQKAEPPASCCASIFSVCSLHTSDLSSWLMSPVSTRNILLSFFRHLEEEAVTPTAQTLAGELPRGDLTYHHCSNWKSGAGLQTIPPRPASHFPNHPQRCKPFQLILPTMSSLPTQP